MSFSSSAAELVFQGFRDALTKRGDDILSAMRHVFKDAYIEDFVNLAEGLKAELIRRLESASKHLTWLHLKEQFPIIQKKIDEGRAAGKAILYRLQFEGALEGNTTLLMYLGRYVLGYGANANDQISTQAHQPALPELSDEAKQHLIDLAQAVCDAAHSTPTEKPANAKVVENVITPDFKAGQN